VSRTAYREALRILAAKGMIESRPKAGTHVTGRARWNLLDPEVLDWMFSGPPNEAFIVDLFELRALIEPAAAGLAAQRRTEAQVTAMQQALDEMTAHSLATERGRLADQNFHRLIIEAANNEALGTLISAIGSAVSWTTQFKQRQRALPRDPLPDHVAVFEAIRKGSHKTAMKAMSKLLDLALNDMDIVPRSRL
jgi:DNA-binding FadR family transcriptional regulator